MHSIAFFGEPTSNADLRWHYRFLTVAALTAQWSKDPNKKVGAVIVKDRVQLGGGYNGFPRGVQDTPARYEDKELKLKLTVHAEPNAIHNCFVRPVGATLYVTPLSPCSNCAGHIIQAGIVQVVYPASEMHKHSSWADEMELAALMFREAGVSLLALTGNARTDFDLIYKGTI